MRIFTRYMAGRFFRPFFYGLGLFALLIFMGDMFDRMPYLVKSKASLGTILKYLWLEVPYWSVRIIPMATLLATLIAMTGFVQSGEWIAAQSCGFRVREFWVPVLWCSVVVGVFSFAAQETVLPVCYRLSRQIWHEEINPQWEYEKFLNVIMIGEPGQFISASEFLSKLGRMERPVYEEIGPEGLEKQLDAKFALWDAGIGRWIFHEGVERRFDKGAVKEIPFKSAKSDLAVPPPKLIPRARSPEEMSLRELKKYSGQVRHLGASMSEYLTAAHAKVAYPFTNIIICALGIPVALRLGTAARVISFTAALGISFLYLWFFEMGRALGNGGRLPPAAAAWVANIFFGTLAAWLLKRYDA